MLDGPDRAEAMDLIRSMIERVELAPRDGDKCLEAVLFGDLAAILAASAGADKQKLPGAGGTRGVVVAVGRRATKRMNNRAESLHVRVRRREWKLPRH